MENGKLKAAQTKANLKDDAFNIALLFFLYTLQGIPLGLSSAIPMLLLNRGVTYKQQVWKWNMFICCYRIYLIAGRIQLCNMAF